MTAFWFWTIFIFVAGMVFGGVGAFFAAVSWVADAEAREEARNEPFGERG